MDRSWYNNPQNAASEWYAPASPNDPVPEDSRKPALRWLKPFIAIILVIALIAGSSVVFSSRSAADHEGIPSQDEKNNEEASSKDKRTEKTRFMEKDPS